jgi:mannose-6-phosphate isomerase-like protein (cupin superfamily)
MTTRAELDLSGAESKEEVFARVEKYLGELSLGFTNVDSERPWGGFFVIDETQTSDFITEYFPDYDQDQIAQFGNKLSPKILVVGPGMNLSWQYHDRRAELWKTVVGPVGYKRSLTDEQGETQLLNVGETVQFDPSERHRLMGLKEWGVVAEIWQHTDPTNPSEESDIVRLADDFGR